MSTSEKKAKIFYEHGKDALALALSVAHMQEEKALRKVERFHQSQPEVGKTRPERKNEKRKRLEEAKLMIAKRRTDAKKEKARSRKESRRRLRRAHDAQITAPEDTTTAAPRKRVSFG